MLAGALSDAGYYMGDRPTDAGPANPKGYFEDWAVIGINERILEFVLPSRPPRPLGRLFRGRPTLNQRWLARVPVDTPIFCSEAVAGRILDQTSRRPFCFKDPRFCYTLPAWRPFLGDPGFVCIFREPGRTATSMLKEAAGDRDLDLSLSWHDAIEVWKLMYRHVLDLHRHRGEWLFVHYDQVLGERGGAQDRSLPGRDVQPVLPGPCAQSRSGRSQR